MLPAILSVFVWHTDYLKTGRKPSADWEAKYERTVKAFDAEDGDEEEAGRGKKVRPRPRWRRMYRPDDDEAWDDPFNPVAKTGPSYNDIFDLNRRGDARDVIQVAFEDVDLGHDEIPDGAEDFFGVSLGFAQKKRNCRGPDVVFCCVAGA